mmetsp:Transcript_61557/g.144804  ORF Transcript_61557/g.144804 Transcript_61557/m.144804 type:complete len:84 (+) Transcript_61557:495-746(+)
MARRHCMENSLRLLCIFHVSLAMKKWWLQGNQDLACWHPQQQVCASSEVELPPPPAFAAVASHEPQGLLVPSFCLSSGPGLHS